MKRIFCGGYMSNFTAMYIDPLVLLWTSFDVSRQGHQVYESLECSYAGTCFRRFLTGERVTSNIPRVHELNRVTLESRVPDRNRCDKFPHIQFTYSLTIPH